MSESYKNGSKTEYTLREVNQQLLEFSAALRNAPTDLKRYTLGVVGLVGASLGLFGIEGLNGAAYDQLTSPEGKPLKENVLHINPEEGEVAHLRMTRDATDGTYGSAMNQYLIREPITIGGPLTEYFDPRTGTTWIGVNAEISEPDVYGQVDITDCTTTASDPGCTQLYIAASNMIDIKVKK